MSGIIGIINQDGAPVDRQILQRLTEFMAFRGPDAQAIWCEGSAGLGHAMLHTTNKSVAEHQPFSLDGKVWITADARVDDRAELIRGLKSQGRDNLDSATDVELILHAYHAWDKDCVQHLLGDFAFAIWDGHQQRLFCARDHFGVKPFFYAQAAKAFVFSNTLNGIRLHSAVSDDLNDLAIADFLLFDMNADPATTAFADIQRLPPAHTLTWSGGALRLNRYWTLPTDGHVRFKRADDYVERFKELLRDSVNDRLRTDHVGIFMSGGLDSTALAAIARTLLSKQFASFDLRAYTVVYDRLIPDQERLYSGLAAEALGIPIEYLAADNYTLFERRDQPGFQPPEPSLDIQSAVGVDQYRQIAGHSRVVLTGYDGDAILTQPMPSYFHLLFKNLQFGRMALDFVRYLRWERTVSGLGIGEALRRRIRKQPATHGPLYPTWLDPALATHLDLRKRWERENVEAPPVHAGHPDAYRSLTSISLWQFLLESYDPAVSQFPLEVRHPLIDLRLVNYALAIPAVPWCIKKKLLRMAMQDILPEPVLRRPKSPLAGEPVVEGLKQPQAQWIDHFDPVPELAKYVDRDAIPSVFANEDVNEVWMNLRPITLNYWLQGMKPTQKAVKENEDDYANRNT